MKVVIWEQLDTDIESEANIVGSFNQWVLNSEEGKWIAANFGRHNLNYITYMDQTYYQKWTKVYLDIEPCSLLTEYLLRFGKKS
jgi:hypothetical protein